VETSDFKKCLAAKFVRSRHCAAASHCKYQSCKVDKRNFGTFKAGKHNFETSEVGKHNFGICKKNATAQWRLRRNFAAKHIFKSEVADAQRHSLCKSQNHAQT